MRLRKRVKHLLRPVVYRTLSPSTIQGLRFRYWYLSYYLPHLLSSRIVGRMPEVRQFGAALVPSIAKQLQTTNILAPTEMCRVMTKFGSDKGSNKYTTLYSALFKERRDQPLRVFELGLGSNNLAVASNMGVFGAPGASHRGWREVFPHALVYGADIDRGILFEETRIKTYYCDQLDRSSIRELWSQPELRDGVDIIVEDGLHTFEANVSFLEGSLEHLRPGGTYVIEDIGWDSFDKWYDRLERIYSKHIPSVRVRIRDLGAPWPQQHGSHSSAVRLGSGRGWIDRWTVAGQPKQLPASRPKQQIDIHGSPISIACLLLPGLLALQER